MISLIVIILIGSLYNFKIALIENKKFNFLFFYLGMYQERIGWNKLIEKGTLPKPIQEGKTMAIIAYIFWLGLVISIYMNNKDKNTFTSFHIRQSFDFPTSYNHRNQIATARNEQIELEYQKNQKLNRAP